MALEMLTPEQIALVIPLLRRLSALGTEWSRLAQSQGPAHCLMTFYAMGELQAVVGDAWPVLQALEPDA